MSLLAYCQTAIRLGCSQSLAYLTYREHHPTQTRAGFRRAWRAAQAAEALFTPLGGLRR